MPMSRALLVFAALLACSRGEDAQCESATCDNGEESNSEVVMLQVTRNLMHSDGNMGLSTCPCLGIADLPGTINTTIDGQVALYDADVGSSCKTWDYGHHPECLSLAAAAPFCHSKWCYVDPCNCQLENAEPKTSAILQGALFQNKPMYFSYETCGERDTFTADYYSNACVNQHTMEDCFKLEKCSWSIADGCRGKELNGAFCGLNSQNELLWGMADCPCVGISNTVGTALAEVNGTTYDFPSEVGSHCQAWDEGTHPSCLGRNPPSWCSQNWCFVDPCTCPLAVPPKLSTYFPSASFRNHSIYYSYHTCRATDTYTAGSNPTACVNLFREPECLEQGDRCAWANLGGTMGCMGKDLANVCAEATPVKSGATTRSDVLALLLVIAAAPASALW